jgi:hypothetical protein
MVISQILGGLGNQMFQYAAGRALSLDLESGMQLDLRGFKGYALHNGFEIGRVFFAPVEVAKSIDVKELLGWRSGVLTRKILKRTKSSTLHGPNLAIEPHFNYWPRLRKFGPSCYLMGYWQSEKYFYDYEQTIRSDFSFQIPLEAENLKNLLLMENCNSVSLHVRRGDYLSHAPTAKMFNVCSIDYYRDAIAYIAAQVPSPNFFVFSDDLQWARNNIRTPYPTEYIVGNNGVHSYIDMQLMSSCKHHIIANSTFSWWGAWLNPARQKIVIAPKNWFCNGTNDEDLIPEQWIRL